MHTHRITILVFDGMAVPDSADPFEVFATASVCTRAFVLAAATARQMDPTRHDR